MIKIVCTSCQKPLSLDETKLPMKEVSFPCPVCKTKLTVDRRNLNAAPASAAPAAARIVHHSFFREPAHLRRQRRIPVRREPHRLQQRPRLLSADLSRRLRLSRAAVQLAPLGAEGHGHELNKG